MEVEGVEEGGPPPPEVQVNFWEMEEHTRQSIGQCYDDGVFQLAANLGAVVIDARGKRFKVNASLDEIKEKWLKERTVIFIFQDEARELSRGVKEDLIRAYEDGWAARRLFNPELRRGRVKFEGPNVVSYVAKATEVATWLAQKGTISLNLKGKDYTVTLKPWMTKQELKELKLREAENNFWIVALRVPLEAMYYVASAAEGLVGGVKYMHPPEADRTKPKLVNVKLDMEPQVRFRVEDHLMIESPSGEIWKVEIATPFSDWCRKCWWYFHTEENCPRQSSDGSPRRVWANSRLPSQQAPVQHHQGIQVEDQHVAGQVPVAPLQQQQQLRPQQQQLSQQQQLPSQQQQQPSQQQQQPSQLSHAQLNHPFDASAPSVSSPTGILEYAKMYYSDILTSRRPREEVDADLSSELDMWEDTDRSLSATDCLSLDRPFTLEELQHTLAVMAAGKCPGRDGLTVEFYRNCWDAVGPPLVEVYNKVLIEENLGELMTFGVISVLFKKGDKASIRNYRPISVLNVSYKLLAKALALRLGKILPKLVERDQGAFVQGRSIFINILTTIESIEVLREENLNMAVLLLDMEKAYNRVGWPFVLTTLRKMGFGPCFCKWVVAMYTTAKSAVQVNGHLSEAFHLSRSLRQGCPLAPLSFVLQLEVQLNRFRKHPRIRGLRISPSRECRVKALADDLFVISDNSLESMLAVKEVLAEYSQLSEALVNWNKSVYLLPQAFALCVEWGMVRVDPEKGERFLGVLVSTQSMGMAQGAVLQQKVVSKIQSWGFAGHLSLFGRAMVVNIALFSLVGFVGAVREITGSTLSQVRRLAARFVWKPRAKGQEGFVSKLAWDLATFPREQGGLGLIDPQRRNQAQLRKWLANVAMAEEKEDWVFLAERRLQREWQLSRGDDEVLVQTLFENPFILNNDGVQFSAGPEAGAFGRSWIRRGVLRISDLWSDLLGGWKPLEEFRLPLYGLRRVEENWRTLLQVILSDWQALLGPEGLDPPGTWYAPVNEQPQDVVWKLQGLSESGFRKVQEWKRVGPTGKLQLLGEKEISVWQNPPQIRVVEYRDGRNLLDSVVWVGNAPLCSLPIDPRAWGWSQGRPSTTSPACYDLVSFSTQESYKMTRNQSRTPAAVAAARWSAVLQLDLQDCTEDFEELWRVLFRIGNSYLLSYLGR
ncbi:hypothetical protein CBR_g31137 [Chara braunii]|uniref:Reverse transcriptase domain-containing protein n=1 Tax=Chara braunii TaxID=69332 RepID=A0A388LEF1_CHABU|nr:hypothetical protein CBR_g31137 [Chara braunii]|eukprot:GBG80678.1 hypothetical protein CBR_g31137 [Chara braunii]